MTLKEAIKEQHSDFLYIGSGSSFIWIGHKEDAIDEMQKANEFYYTNLRDNTIPKAKNMLRFLDQLSADGLMNDIYLLKQEELNIPQIIEKNEKKLKRIKKEIDKKDETMETMSENQAKEYLKRIKKLEIEHKKIQKENTKLENKLKKLPQKINKLKNKLERLPIEKQKLTAFIAEKEEYLANWTSFLDRTVVDIRPHVLLEPYGTIIVTEGNENGMYWFYEEVLACKRW